MMQLKTLRKRTSSTASESFRNGGIRVSKVRESILRGIADTVSLTVINLKRLKHSLYFLTTHLYFLVKMPVAIRSQCLNHSNFNNVFPT